MFEITNCTHPHNIMDSSHAEQMRRLSKYRSTMQRRQQRRRSPRLGSAQVVASASSSRVVAASDNATVTTVQETAVVVETQDPLIFPGLYSPSGFDMFNVLVRVATRPAPIINVGAVDSSCALVVADIKAPDMPIVYVSEAFEILTGYTTNEIMGKNCRFLQSPDGDVSPGEKRKHGDNDQLWQLRQNVYGLKESQYCLPNFKKDGTPFINLLTLIPVRWDSSDFRYIVGFQVDKAAVIRR